MTALKHKRAHHADFHDDVEKIKAALQQASDDFKDKASELWTDSVEGVKEHTADAKKSIENYTSEKPLQTIGIALLVGVALGYFLHK